MIKDQLSGVYKAMGMDHDGMFTPHPCHVCGNPLNDDGGHPAELYAGTHTGLCYPCTFASPFRVHVYRDRAERWSHAPHSPSWRRDREEFIGYKGCRECSGKGKIVVARHHTAGGGYPVNCEKCDKKYYDEPERARWNNRMSWIINARATVNEKKTKELRKILKLKKSDALPFEHPTVVAVSKKLTTKLDRINARWRELSWAAFD